MARHGGRRVVGIVVLVAGVVGAAALWLGAERRYDDAVANLAPAPIGCDTTLTFDRGGRYTFFVETKGHVGEIAGDCQSAARSYDLASAPRVALTLVDSAGRAVDLDRTAGPSYDRAGQRGEGVRSVQIDRAGTYVLTATGPTTDAVIRVGHDPARGVAALHVTAVLVLIVGVIVGILVILLDRPRAKPAPPGTPLTTWPTGLPTKPPLGPPPANPPIPPPYTPRPPAAPQPAPARWPPAGPPDSAPRPPGGWPGRSGPSGAGGQLPPPSPPSPPDGSGARPRSLPGGPPAPRD